MVQRTRNFWLVFAALFAFSAMTTSCSDDDDDDDNGGPSIESGQTDLTVTGSKDASVSGSGVTFSDTTQTFQGTDIEQVTVSYSDTAGNNMTVQFASEGSVETGTYEPASGSGASESVSAQLRVDGDQYNSIESGNVELNSRSEDNVVGTFNDTEISAVQGDSTITVNGSFNAEAQ